MTYFKDFINLLGGLHERMILPTKGERRKKETEGERGGERERERKRKRKRKRKRETETDRQTDRQTEGKGKKMHGLSQEKDRQKERRTGRMKQREPIFEHLGIWLGPITTLKADSCLNRKTRI